MAYKAIISSVNYGSDAIPFTVTIYSTANGPYALDSTNLTAYLSDFPDVNIDTIKSLIQTATVTWANGMSYTMTNSDVIFPQTNIISNSLFTTLTQARAVTDGVSHTFVTTAAAANGFQISSTRDTLANYTVTVSSAVQVGLVTNVSGYCVLEVAATNSATAGDWKEKARVGTGQNVGLAVALSSTQTATASLFAMVPAAYYVRLRTVNSNGTPTYTYITGTEVLV